MNFRLSLSRHHLISTLAERKLIISGISTPRLIDRETESAI